MEINRKIAIAKTICTQSGYNIFQHAESQNTIEKPNSIATIPFVSDNASSVKATTKKFPHRNLRVVDRTHLEVWKI